MMAATRGPRLLASDVDPVLAADCHRAHRVFSRVVTEFQLGMIQEASESVPQLEWCTHTLWSWRSGGRPTDASCFDTDLILARIGLDSSWRKARRASSVKPLLRATRSTRKSWSILSNDLNGFLSNALSFTASINFRRACAQPPHRRFGGHHLVCRQRIHRCWEDSFKVVLQTVWDLLDPAKPELSKDRRTSRPTVLPEISLMIFSPGPSCICTATGVSSAWI